MSVKNTHKDRPKGLPHETFVLREGEQILDNMCVLWKRKDQPAKGKQVTLRDGESYLLATVVYVDRRLTDGTFDITLKTVKPKAPP